MVEQTPKNIPTVFVVFGATGDLMGKKIVPALFHLYGQGALPKMFRIIGVARRELTAESFQAYVGKLLDAHRELRSIDSDIRAKFLNLFSYHQGFFDNEEDYKRLATTLGNIDGTWRVCANKLFYLSVPPQYYETICTHLHSSGLTTPCGAEEGWTRVIVEKPFGKDFESAQRLDELLGRLFKEVQIYRIDHYLAKEMLQNILSFRFANNLFEKNWDSTVIDKIELRLLESIGVDDRGAFYDGVGALRDVGQNHLLQMLALITMEHPTTFIPETIRSRRAEMLEELILPAGEPIGAVSYRAQYRGYRAVKGVAKDSTTETYFKIKGELRTPRFKGIPIVLEGGKKLGNPKKEIVVTFKHTTPCLCPPNKHLQNRLVFHLGPREGITIQFWAKKPGLKMELEERAFEFLFRDKRRNLQYVEEYEKLLLDCIAGDQTLFVSTQEVRAMWKFIDPIVCSWQKNEVPLRCYTPNTNQSLTESTKLVEANVAKSEIGSDLITLRKEISVIGLGKMGANFARNLKDHGWRVIGFNRTADVTRALSKEGIEGIYNLKELKEKLAVPRIVWLMLPAGAPTDEMIFGKEGLVHVLAPGDIIIDGGNALFKDSAKRYAKVKRYKLHFVDVGFSGGPTGARTGACLMVGGSRALFDRLEPLYRDAAAPNAYAHFEGQGAGHFVKLVHNAIEYGMLQAIAEGFAVLKKSPYKIDLKKAAETYNQRSVVESRLVGWLKNGFDQFGEKLEEVSGKVVHSKEVLDTIKSQGVSVPIIEGAFKFRRNSSRNPSYTGKVLNVIRNQFGGHAVNEIRDTRPALPAGRLEIRKKAKI
ncbi:MAG: glucose-6-phosphate dehydrogenase [bacterium]|nr:glucose-6-phosphate dehydrogenase [bacterium]